MRFLRYQCSILAMAYFVFLVMWKNRDGHSDYDRMVLWNPATRELKMLPLFPQQPNLYFVSHLGFGFDPKTNDYKVVRIMNFCSGIPP
jgi:hypothetical protein